MIKVSLCYQCTDKENTAGQPFKLSVADKCIGFFYDSTFRPSWLKAYERIQYKLNPAFAVKAYHLSKLYEVVAGDCPSFTCEVRDTDCSTPGTSFSSEVYINVGNIEASNVLHWNRYFCLYCQGGAEVYT